MYKKIGKLFLLLLAIALVSISFLNQPVKAEMKYFPGSAWSGGPFGEHICFCPTPYWDGCGCFGDVPS